MDEDEGGTTQTLSLIDRIQPNSTRLKSVTHNFFSAGLGLLVVARIGSFLPFSLVLTIWLVLSTNFTIDAFGHSMKGGRMTRSWTTHSVFTAPLWGATIGFLTVAVSGNLLRFTPATDLQYLSVGLGVLASYSHLFLDALTEGGVYFERTRIAIAHFSNNNFLLNSLFILLGVFLGITGLATTFPVSP